MIVRPSVNLLLWALHVTQEHFSVLPGIKQAGGEGVEVPLIVRAPDSDFRALRKAVEDAGLVVSSAVTVMDEHTDPSCEGNQASALDHLKWCINTLHLLTAGNGSNLPSVLCGPLYGQLGERPNPAPTDEEMFHRWATAANVLRLAAIGASDTNVVLALEPINRFEIVAVNSLRHGAKIVEIADHPRVRMMFDTHHMHLGEGRHPHLVLRRLIKRNFVIHGHISHHNRGIPGVDDQINYLPYFEALEELGYRGWLAIEAFGTYGPDERALQAATCTWHPPFRNPEDVYRGGIALIRSFTGATA